MLLDLGPNAEECEMRPGSVFISYLSTQGHFCWLLYTGLSWSKEALVHSFKCRLSDDLPTHCKPGHPTLGGHGREGVVADGVPSNLSHSDSVKTKQTPKVDLHCCPICLMVMDESQTISSCRRKRPLLQREPHGSANHQWRHNEEKPGRLISYLVMVCLLRQRYSRLLWWCLRLRNACCSLLDKHSHLQPITERGRWCIHLLTVL